MGRSIERWHARSRLLAGGRSTFLRLRRCAASVATVTIEAQASKPVNLGRWRQPTGSVGKLDSHWSSEGVGDGDDRFVCMAFACYIRSTKRTNSQRYSYRDRRAHTRPRSRQTPRPVVTNPDSSRRDNSFVSDDDNDPDHSVVAPGSFAASCLDRLRLSARAWLSFLRWSGVIAFRRAFDRSFSAARCSSASLHCRASMSFGCRYSSIPACLMRPHLFYVCSPCYRIRHVLMNHVLDK